MLLQSFFRDRSNFSYDLKAGYGYGYEAMGKFLEQRRGFCQQFAATMAMMARTLGIPSRVVVGFLQPCADRGRVADVITTNNVHAWPELYFDGRRLGEVRAHARPVGAPAPTTPRTTRRSTPSTQTVNTDQPSRPTQQGDPTPEAIDRTHRAAGGGRWQRR